MTIAELLSKKMVVEEFQGYKRSLISKAKLEIIIEQQISKLDNMPMRVKNSFQITSDHS
jgi:hypothetical protein